MKKEPLALKPEVAAVYTVAPGVVSKFFDTVLGMTDLSTIDLAQAHHVAARGYLVRKPSGKA